MSIKVKCRLADNAQPIWNHQVIRIQSGVMTIEVMQVEHKHSRASTHIRQLQGF